MVLVRLVAQHALVVEAFNGTRRICYQSDEAAVGRGGWGLSQGEDDVWLGWFIVDGF
jgi:hypothetical protein